MPSRTRFAAEGASVVITGRTETSGHAVQEEIRAAGGEATYVRADFARESDVEHAIDTTVQKYGGLTTLVNNAAPTDLVGPGRGDRSLGEITDDAWDAIMTVALKQIVWCTRHSVPHLTRCRRCRDREHLVGGGDARGARYRRVHGREGRDQRVDPFAGGRARRERRARQHDRVRDGAHERRRVQDDGPSGDRARDPRLAPHPARAARGHRQRRAVPRVGRSRVRHRRESPGRRRRAGEDGRPRHLGRRSPARTEPTTCTTGSR